MVNCYDCAYYLKAFSICTNGFIMKVDPQAKCVSLIKQKDMREIQDSPIKQLTPLQYTFLKNTDFIVAYDEEGWLTEVSVRGMPKTKPLVPIPHAPVTFSFYDQKECGNLVYSRNPENPSVLVFSPLMDEYNYTIYKQWNANRFPPGSESRRIPAMAVPSHLLGFHEIASLIASRMKTGGSHSKKFTDGLSADIYHPSPDIERTQQLWRAMNYTTGEIRLPDGTRTMYFAYHTENRQAVVFVENESIKTTNIWGVAEMIEVPLSTEKEILGGLHLSNHCILCGHTKISPFTINPICTFCLRKGSVVVFNP